MDSILMKVIALGVVSLPFIGFCIYSELKRMRASVERQEACLQKMLEASLLSDSPGKDFLEEDIYPGVGGLGLEL